MKRFGNQGNGDPFATWLLPGLGLAVPTPTTGPVVEAVQSGPSYSLPAGMVWVDQSADQYLSASDAAKIGSFCLSPTPGTYTVGGNGTNSILFCKSSPTDNVLACGAAALVAYFVLPKPINWIVALGIGGIGVLAGTLGSVAI